MDLPERIRSRRRALGLTGYELARRAEVSPSYISLIENGLKVPTEEVAARLARILEDSEEDYRIWAATARISNVARQALSGPSGRGRVYQLFSQPPAGVREEFETGAPSGSEEEPVELLEDVDTGEEETAPEPSSPAGPRRAELGVSVRDRVRRMASNIFREQPSAYAGDELQFAVRSPMGHQWVRTTGPEDVSESEVFLVPLLADGADLDEGPVPEGRIAGRLPLHRDLLPIVGPDAVALRVTEGNTPALGSQLRPGDIVVLDRRWSGLRGDSIYALRLRGTLLLCRSLHKGRNVVILSDPAGRAGAADVEIVPVPDLESLRRLVAGRVAVSLRAWW